MHLHRELVSLVLVSILLSSGCGTAVQDYDDPNSIEVGGSTSGVNPKADTDEDGVFDIDEGAEDPNMNGIPAHLDPLEQRLDGVTDDARDSDGDGTPDKVEGTADSNGNGIPAYRDPEEGGTGGSGDGGTTPTTDAGGGQIAFGQACTATATCASAGGVPGCCESLTLTCGGMVGGACQTGKVCGGSFCGGAGACCTQTGACGRLGADGVTCAATGGGGDGGTGSNGGGGGMMVDTCPDVGSSMGCCAQSGRCGLLDALLNTFCLEPDDDNVTDPPPDLMCTP